MLLNIEQRKLVELEAKGHVLVKGVAGSGKTAVAIRRVPFLLKHYCHEKDDDILMITYNKTLVNYIKYQYKKNEDSFDTLNLFDNDLKDVEITNIDKLMFKYFKEYTIKNKKSLNIITNWAEEKKFMVQAINDCKKKFPDVKILDVRNEAFLKDEMGWICACNIVSLEAYQNIDRVGRASGGSNTPQKLLKNSKTRESIFSLMELYYTILEKNKMVDFPKMNLIALEYARTNKVRTYTHIIIDESQDLTKVQLEFLRCLYKEKSHSSIMFIADNTQSIYTNSWLGKGRAYSTIGFDMSGRGRQLSKNYRTTTQISEAAYCLIENDETIQNNIDFVKPALIDRSGQVPIYKFFKTSKLQIEFLISEINNLRNDYDLSEICIVAKEKRIITGINAALKVNNIPNETLNDKIPNFDSDTVKLVTMHSIKGLEFKVVFLVDLNEGVIPNANLKSFDAEDTLESDERKLLYVGMTRANELLYMSSVKKPSKFIGEISNDKLSMKRDSLIHPFRNIGIPDYEFSDDIIDINSKEEVVRQWLIKELINTYGYSTSMLKLEYEVQQFSKKGYVDIAVNINHKGEDIPYIFVEVKQPGTGIEDALKQLKTYMEQDNRAYYGVVSDGFDIMIIDREGMEVTDIPKCQPHFLKEQRKLNVYRNIKNGRDYEYSADVDELDDIDIKEKSSSLILEFNQMCSIPLIGDVAAGIPKFAGENYDGSLELPEEWLFNPNETFALKVVGDSMINAGININDYVIVNKQSTAENGDIVIAVVDNEATMKKFLKMGDTILLVPENSAYEPIQMRSDEVIINGKVIGIMNM